MLDGFVGGLFVAFILSLFSVDEMILEVLKPFITTITLTKSHYYILFGLIGLVGGLFRR